MALLNFTKYETGVLAAAFLLLSSQALFAQAFTKYNFSSAAGGASLNYKLEPFPPEVDGSPYYQDDWQPGAIYNNDNTYTELTQLKYNVYIDELVFLHEGTQYIVPRKLKIERFTLGEEEFIGAYDGERYSFFKVYEPGKPAMLLKNYKCIVEKGEPSKGYIPATKDEFIVKEKIYVYKPGLDAMEILPRRGQEILPYLQDKRDELETYIKRNRLKMRKLEDLVEIVRYYDSLQLEITPHNN